MLKFYPNNIYPTLLNLNLLKISKNHPTNQLIFPPNNPQLLNKKCNKFSMMIYKPELYYKFDIKNHII